MKTQKEVSYNKPTHILNMSLYQVKKTKLYDVFVGYGWKNHRRIRVTEESISIVEGSEMSNVQRAAILKTIGGQNARN